MRRRRSFSTVGPYRPAFGCAVEASMAASVARCASGRARKASANDWKSVGVEGSAPLCTPPSGEICEFSSESDDGSSPRRGIFILGHLWPSFTIKARWNETFRRIHFCVQTISFVSLNSRVTPPSEQDHADTWANRYLATTSVHRRRYCSKERTAQRVRCG